MSILKIAQIGNPVLRKKARKVPLGRLKEERFQKLIDDIIETMRDANGVGLAANQVYKRFRIITLEVQNNPRYQEVRNIKLEVLINPVIIEASSDLSGGWEGCLSIPLWGKVPRSNSIVVEALSRRGRKIRLKAKNFHARILQHEIDHLDGIVFLDRMKDFSSLCTTEEYIKYCQGG